MYRSPLAAKGIKKYSQFNANPLLSPLPGAGRGGGGGLFISSMFEVRLI